MTIPTAGEGVRAGSPKIQFQNVRKDFTLRPNRASKATAPASFVALSDINLGISAGEFLVVVGPGDDHRGRG